jgi:hypothetical protein
MYLRADFQGSRVISVGVLLLVRELDERLGLTARLQNHLVDSRGGPNTQSHLAELRNGLHLPLNSGQGDWRLTREDGGRMVSCSDGVEIGNSS